MTLISGIPPWMQMYFDRLTSITGKKVGDLSQFQCHGAGGRKF